MSLDGIVTRAIVNELNNIILGGRIDKIYQHEKDELLLNIYNKGKNNKLIISASSNNPRLYLTKYAKSNPLSPPMFCMLLRKNLTGGIILTDKNSKKIIDSIKRVSYDMSRVRQVLPGKEYKYPPINDKVNPLNFNISEFNKFFDGSNPNMKIFKFFYTNYIGLSPLISKEICFISGIDIDRPIGSLNLEDRNILFDSFSSVMNKVKENEYNPVLIKNNFESDYIAFHALYMNQFGNLNRLYLDSISEVLDEYYIKSDTMDRVTQKSQSMKKSIQTKLERSLNKISKQKQELLESEDREKYKVYADLISANLYRIEKGSSEVELENFYTETMEKTKIPLDNRYSPAENAQRYYKKYSKLKNAHSLLLKQIPETQEEIKYLENVLVSIDNSIEVMDLDEIKEELIKEGYLKGNIKKKKKVTMSKPHHYISSDGSHIYVGKNNRQNDFLTLKFAHKEDLWLHIQNMPGSHVIIKGENNPTSDATLLEAAMLAAYYSKGKNSNNVAIDYTEKKNVKKPKNAKTGMVIYESFSTIFVTPDRKQIEKLKKVED